MYRLMWSGRHLSEGDAAFAAFAALVDLTAAVQSHGVLRAGDPAQIAFLTWSCVHGAVSIELDRTVQDLDCYDADADYEALLVVISRGLAP